MHAHSKVGNGLHARINTPLLKTSLVLKAHDFVPRITWFPRWFRFGWEKNNFWWMTLVVDKNCFHATEDGKHIVDKSGKDASLIEIRWV